MRFDLKNMSEAQFNAIHQLVRAVVLTGRLGYERFLPAIIAVTDDAHSLDASKRSFALSDKYSGLTWTGMNGVTSIWVDPTIDNTRDVCLTVLHELSHAYNLDNTGMHRDNHGPHWRRLFGMTLIHWCELTGRDKYSLLPFATNYRREFIGTLNEQKMIIRAAEIKKYKVLDIVGDLFE